MNFLAVGSAMMLFIEVMSRVELSVQFETVRFQSGATSATLEGEVSGYDSVKYLVSGHVGQVMSAKLTPDNHACHIRVWTPGADHPEFVGAVKGHGYQARLGASGIYTVQVHLARGAARRGDTCLYRMTLGLTGDASNLTKGRHGPH